MPTPNKQLPLVNSRLPQAEAMSPAEARAAAREEADAFLEDWAMFEYYADRARRHFVALYRRAFKEDPPEYEPEFRKQAG